MNLRFLVVFFTLIQLIAPLDAQFRSQEEALHLALSHLDSASPERQRTKSGSALLVPVNLNKSSEKPVLYLFNRTDRPGYIIISGDERAREVLAYSDSHFLDTVSIPENLEYWLSVYNDEINLLANNPGKETGIQHVPVTIQPVAPLLGQIKWNQGDPYNLLCPVIDQNTGKKAVTGCVATGMAQVMRFHRWPETGTGSKSYTTRTLKIPLAVDFSTTHYDWDNMTSGYSSSSTATEKSAVATLMYHCGVAASMDYNNSSGAYVTDMGRALVDHFGYSIHLQVLSRNYFDREQWEHYLMEELRASRPVLYSGSDADRSGHLWVCDGVDQNGYFHFNWGWGGMSDGYFAISALNPSSQGIGGNAGGYNYGQQITVGIQKPVSGTVPVLAIYLNETPVPAVSEIIRTGSFTVNFNKLFNYGINSVSVQLGIGVFEGDSIVGVSAIQQINELKSMYGWNSIGFSGITIPGTVTPGVYSLRLVNRLSSRHEWTKVPVRVGVPDYLEMIVDPQQIKLKVPQNQSPLLELQELEKTGNFYQGKPARVSMSIANTGKEYNSVISLQLSPVAGGTSTEITRDLINLENGEIRTINWNKTIDVSPGEYWLSVMVDASNYSDSPVFTVLGEPLKVTVLPPPVAPPVLSLTNALSFPDNNSVIRDKPQLTASVTNTGGMFENYIGVFIFNATGGSSVASMGYQHTIVDSLETVTIQFTTPIDLAPGKYMAAIYQYSDAGWKQMTPSSNSLVRFTLIENTETALELVNLQQVEIYPNPVQNELYIRSDEELTSVSVYGSDGRCVYFSDDVITSPHCISLHQLASGVYFLKAETRSGKGINQRFIKK